MFLNEKTPVVNAQSNTVPSVQAVPSNKSRNPLIICSIVIVISLATLCASFVLYHRNLNNNNTNYQGFRARDSISTQINHMYSTLQLAPLEFSKYALVNPFCILPNGTVNFGDTDLKTGVCISKTKPFLGVIVKYNEKTNSYTITAKWSPDNDTNHLQQISGEFKPPVVSYTDASKVLNVYRRGVTLGTVNSEQPGISCGLDCSEAYADVTAVKLIATPIKNAKVLRWTNCDSSSGNECTVKVDGLKYVTVAFTADK